MSWRQLGRPGPHRHHHSFLRIALLPCPRGPVLRFHYKFFFTYYPAHVESRTRTDTFIITSLKVRHYMYKIHFILNRLCRISMLVYRVTYACPESQRTRVWPDRTFAKSGCTTAASGGLTVDR